MKGKRYEKFMGLSDRKGQCSELRIGKQKESADRKRRVRVRARVGVSGVLRRCVKWKVELKVDGK